MIHNFVSYINQPRIKENLKFLIEVGKRCTLFPFLFSEAIAAGESKKTQNSPLSSRARLILCSKISMYSSVFCNPTVQMTIGWIAHCFFTSQRLENIFGPNINFAGNWKHPRHVVSLVSFGFGVPAVIYSLWLFFREDSELEKGCSQKSCTLSHRNLIFLTTINTLISRPALHIANQIARKLFLKTS